MIKFVVSKLKRRKKNIVDEIWNKILACCIGQVLQQLKDKALKRAELREDEIMNLIEERAVARKNKMFSRGDEIRSELAAKGIALMDVGKETVWRPCVPLPRESPQPAAKEQPQTIAKGQPQLTASKEQPPAAGEEQPEAAANEQQKVPRTSV